MGNCKTKGCKHYALDGRECRYCKGRRDFESIVTLRAVLTFIGAKIKQHKGFFGPSIKKKVAKVKPTVITEQKLGLVRAERVKVGMVLAADHGEVISMEKRQGRKLVESVKKGKKSFRYVKGGTKGILFQTTKRNVWFPAGEEVWIVTGTTERAV